MGTMGCCGSRQNNRRRDSISSFEDELAEVLERDSRFEMALLGALDEEKKFSEVDSPDDLVWQQRLLVEAKRRSLKDEGYTEELIDQHFDAEQVSKIESQQQIGMDIPDFKDHGESA